MQNLKASIRCNDRIILRDIDVWRADWGRSQTGRLELPIDQDFELNFPDHQNIELSLPYSVEWADGKREDIYFTRVSRNGDRIILGFAIRKANPEVAPSSSAI